MERNEINAQVQGKVVQRIESDDVSTGPNTSTIYEHQHDDDIDDTDDTETKGRLEGRLTLENKDVFVSVQRK